MPALLSSRKCGTRILTINTVTHRMVDVSGVNSHSMHESERVLRVDRNREKKRKKNIGEVYQIAIVSHFVGRTYYIINHIFLPVNLNIF